MESVKMKKATKTVAFRQLLMYCDIIDNQLFTDAECKICKYKWLIISAYASS